MRTPEQIVQAEVCACVSYLVVTLAGADYEHGADDLGSMMDQAQELAAPIDDWEEAAIQAGFEHGGDFDGFWFDAKEYDGWKDAASNGPTFASAQAICESEGVDPYQWEVFEHWIVTDWFADCLIEHGEKVDKDFAGLCVWARTTTGQAIYADSVIEAIAAAHCDWVWA